MCCLLPGFLKIWSVWCSLNLEMCWHCQLIITKLRLTVGHICCGLGGQGWRSQCASLTGAQLGSWASSSNFLTPEERWVETRGAMMVTLESSGLMSGGTTSLLSSPRGTYMILTLYIIIVTTRQNILGSKFIVFILPLKSNAICLKTAFMDIDNCDSGLDTDNIDYVFPRQSEFRGNE